jgi:hypothetical protein
VTAFAAAIDALFADPNLALGAVYGSGSGGAGKGVPIRVILRRPERIVEYGEPASSPKPSRSTSERATSPSRSQATASKRTARSTLSKASRSVTLSGSSGRSTRGRNEAGRQGDLNALLINEG